MYMYVCLIYQKLLISYDWTVDTPCPFAPIPKWNLQCDLINFFSERNEHVVGFIESPRKCGINVT